LRRQRRCCGWWRGCEHRSGRVEQHGRICVDDADDIHRRFGWVGSGRGSRPGGRTCDVWRCGRRLQRGSGRSRSRRRRRRRRRRRSIRRNRMDRRVVLAHGRWHCGHDRSGVDLPQHVHLRRRRHLRSRRHRRYRHRRQRRPCRFARPGGLIERRRRLLAIVRLHRHRRGRRTSPSPPWASNVTVTAVGVSPR